jgi:hypothetical protein
MDQCIQQVQDFQKKTSWRALVQNLLQGSAGDHNFDFSLEAWEFRVIGWP